MKINRQHQRFIRRLEVEFSSGDRHYRGISSNFSLGGLFVRTNHPFAPGTLIDLTVHLPEGRTAALRGLVKMAMKTPAVSIRNGMGVEIVERDPAFVDFMRYLSPEEDPLTEEEIAPPEDTSKNGPVPGAAHNPEDMIVIVCSVCGIGNRVRKTRISRILICGKCGASLTPPA